MPFASQLELQGSPTEQSTAADQVYSWDPANDGLAGEAWSGPVAIALQYDPLYPYDTKDVTATLVAAGYPQMGSGLTANKVLVKLTGAQLTAGLEVRVELKCSGSLGSLPFRFFRVRCQF